MDILKSIPNDTASYFKVRVGDKCCHEEIKIIFRLVCRLDGTAKFHK